MKTDRRHELETNTLAAALSRAIERIKPYSTTLVGVAVAVALIIGAYVYLSARTRTQAAQGWDRYFKAMQESGTETLADVAEEYRGTPAGAWARLRLADIQFIRGSNLLFQSRAEGYDQLRRAVESYQAVLDQADADLLQQRARYGLAQANESLNELEKASDAYHALIDRFPDSAFRLLAERRLKDLDKRSTKQFYDWFASQDPRPAFEPPFDDTPEFDLDSLPDPPDDQSSSIFEVDTFRTGEPVSVADGDKSPLAETADAPAEPEKPSSEQPPSEEGLSDDPETTKDDSSSPEESGASSSPVTGEAISPPENEPPP